MIIAVICVALNLIIYYDIICFGALGILIVSILQKDQKKMLINLAAFYLAVIIVIGMPLGLIKAIEPETDVPPSEVAKEVQSWLN